MARKAVEKFEYIAPEDKATVRMFQLKKHEITMMAANEVEKLKSQLIFVSMADYNRVIEENRRLRDLIDKMKEAPPYVSLTEAIKIARTNKEGIKQLIKEDKVRVVGTGRTMKYYREDLLRVISEKNLTSGLESGSMK